MFGSLRVKSSSKRGSARFPLVEAHHVVPLSSGTHAVPNGVALCRPCHELTFREA